MKALPRWRAWLAIPLLILSLAIASRAQSQAAAVVQISNLNTEAFPQLSLFLSVTDGTGQVVSGLRAANFTVLEDDNPLSGIRLQEMAVGRRLIYVLHPTPAMLRKFPQGTTLYDQLRAALLDLWSRADTSLLGSDDLSLIVGDTTLSSHTSLSAELGSQLDLFAPVFDPAAPLEDSLSQALTLAADPLAQPGMPRQLILISSALPAFPELSLANTIARAVESNTVIHVVLAEVAPQELTGGTEGLAQLAQATGGQFLVFDPSQGFSSLASTLSASGSIYQLSVPSQANTSGPHSIRVQVSASGLEGVSDSRSYELIIQPPQVTFIQPPAKIERRPQDPSRHLETLSPSGESLRVLIEFPDGYPRPIVASWLMVDSEIADTRNAQPYDQFAWDLSSYFQSGTHRIQAIVQDSLGLEGTTLDTSVQVEVARPPGGLTAILPALEPLLAGLGLLLVVLVLGAILITFTRRAGRTGADRPRSAGRPRIDLERVSLRSHTPHTPPEALLVPEDDEGLPTPTIALSGAELTLGSDANLVSAVLNDPSVSGFHARIIRLAGGDYQLRDQGSVAGSWINYELVPEDGRVLRHNDLINLGRVAFRFRLSVPPISPMVRITPVEPQTPSPASSSEPPSS